MLFDKRKLLLKVAQELGAVRAILDFSKVSQTPIEQIEQFMQKLPELVRPPDQTGSNNRLDAPVQWSTPLTFEGGEGLGTSSLGLYGI